MRTRRPSTCAPPRLKKLSLEGAHNHSTWSREPRRNTPPRESDRAGPETGRDDVARFRDVQKLHATEHENPGKGKTKRFLRQAEGEQAGNPNPRNGPEEKPVHRMQVDIPLREMAQARNPQESGSVEDVRPHDLDDGQGIDHNPHKAEERAATDRRQPHDETESGADQHRPEAVLSFEQKRGVTRLHSTLDERLRDEAETTEQEGCADRVALGRLDAVAVRIPEPARDGYPEQRHRPDPRNIHAVRRACTVPSRRWRTAPNVLKTAPCRMSVPTAQVGLKPKKRTRIG